MTEKEWLNDQQDPGLMISYFENTRAGPWSKNIRRKLRLLACACCRVGWHRLEDPRLRSIVELAEQYADGQVSFKDLKVAGDGVHERSKQEWADSGFSQEAKKKLAPANSAYALTFDAFGAADYSVRSLLPMARTPTNRVRTKVRDFVRCIFGNPFRAVSIGKVWRKWHDATIVKLAQAAYDERELPSGHLDAKRLAILADALEESGCTNENVLTHLRGARPHVRGCWVVDLLLGRE